MKISRESFENLKFWIKQALENGNEQLSIILVGNKIDREKDREVSFEEGKQYAEENDLLFIESSAKSKKNVKEIFTDLAKVILQKV